ncbi:DUF2786 domain-containing protein [Actinomyces wuliandei]|uniref:DUF2786 domain-containing protein n=1 Tax=Actinomyces wuliandei TaxID=2057743 RepID=UPI00214B1B4E|nr:DUF2786 domain-containing protein [Actinomyces wuliandei]
MATSVPARIRHLLALAADPAASPSERQTASHRAATLMARHSVTSLDPQASRAEEVTTRTITVPGGRSTPSLAQAHAMHHVATAAGAATWYTDHRRHPLPDQRPCVVVHVVGLGSDLDWLIPLLTTLTTQTALDWAAWRRHHAGTYRRHPHHRLGTPRRAHRRPRLRPRHPPQPRGRHPGHPPDPGRSHTMTPATPTRAAVPTAPTTAGREKERKNT